MTREPTVEEQADVMLERDARQRGSTLRKQGILNRRRRAVVDKIEIPLSAFEVARQRRKDGE